jgi:hypothetical protein
LIPKAWVAAALGTVMVVNVAPSVKKPSTLVTASNHPTIWPAVLIPEGMVLLAPGTSMGVKVYEAA